MPVGGRDRCCELVGRALHVPAWVSLQQGLDSAGRVMQGITADVALPFEVTLCHSRRI